MSKKDENQQNNKIVYDQSLTNEQLNKLYKIIKDHFIPEEILYKIRPELKDSYLKRVDPNIKEIIKIDISKMNEEERLLKAYLCESNLKNDLSMLMSYITNIINKLNNPSDKETLKNILIISISNYYASKIRLYSEDATKDDSDEEYDKKLAEENKNRVPLTEEEAQKELEELQSHPMFMTELPENPGDNPYLEELQAMQYDGEPDEVCLDLLKSSKSSLDKYMQTHKFHDLKESMIDICNAIGHGENDASCNHVKFKLYFQRGKMQVLVKNWRYAVEDLSDAIKYIKDMHENENKEEFDNGNIDECYLKLITSYIELKLFKKAKELINNRIKDKNSICKESKKEEYKNLLNKINELKQKFLDDLSKMEAFKNMENEKKILLYDELTLKGIKLENQIINVPIGYQAEIIKDENNLFHFPILIIYEEFNTTDYIQDFAENRLLSDIIDIIFEQGNLPWDNEHRYNKSSCLMYLKSTKIHPVTKYEENTFYPIKNDESLIQVLTSKRVHMNGFPIVSIVSFMSYKYYEHFRKNNIILNRKLNKINKK